MPGRKYVDWKHRGVEATSFNKNNKLQSQDLPWNPISATDRSYSAQKGGGGGGGGRAGWGGGGGAGSGAGGRRWEGV